MALLPLKGGNTDASLKETSFFGRHGQRCLLVYHTFFILTFLFIILPIIANIFLSFTNYNIMKMEWVGLSNYKFLFEDKRLWKSLWNTLIFTIFNLPICMVLGLMLALIMKRGLFGHTFFQAGIYIPYIISMVSASMIWIFMMEPLNGLFNTI